MDVFVLKSYRPVSNPTFISKFLERLVARRLFIHLNSISYFLGTRQPTDRIILRRLR